MTDGSDFGLIFVRNMFKVGNYYLSDHAKVSLILIMISGKNPELNKKKVIIF